ncbi:hypothetical protein ACVILK_000908 [Bradyrhizobium embrapense]
MADLHPIVAEWAEYQQEIRREYQQDPNDDRWKFHGPPKPISDTDLRLYRILSQLLRALEAKGAKISEQEKDIRATIEGENIDFRIREICRQVRVFSKDRRSSSSNLVGTGKLVLEIRTYLRGKHNEEWRETTSKSLDDQLPALVDRFLEGAQILKAWHREIQEREEEQRQAVAQREERQRQAKLELSRRQRLLDLTGDWRAAQELRAFIAALRSGPIEDNLEIQGKTIADWLAWADGVADDLDASRAGAAEAFRKIDGG